MLNHALILIYHRVIELPHDPQLLSVSPNHFSEHLDVLRKKFQPLPLAAMTDCVRKNSLKPRSVAITFDDGYADNLEHAKTLLEKYEIPATIFVISGAIGINRELWWDELERLLLQTKSLPSEISVKTPGINQQWNLGAYAKYDADTDERNRFWNVTQNDDPTERHSTYRSFHTILRRLPHSERSSALVQLSTLAEATAEARPTHRVLTENELLKLSQSPVIEVGAHTQTHPVLSALDPDSQEKEIFGSKKRLEEILQKPIDSFAYPYGGKADYNAISVELVKQGGFQRACSNFSGLIHRRSDIFQLPRMLVRNYGGDEFYRKLRQWFSA